MSAIFTQSRSANRPYYISYIAVTLGLPLIILSAFLMAIAGFQLIVPLLIFNFVVFLPGIALDYFIFVKPFKTKVNLEENIELKEEQITFTRGSNTQSVPYSSITSIEFLNYFVNLGIFIFSLGSFIKKLGIFKISTEKGDFYIPPSFTKRDELLQQLIQRSKLKKQEPTTSSNLRRSLLVWQREAGLYYSWAKSNQPITDKDLIIEVYTKTQTKIGYLAIFVFGVIIVLLILILIAPDFLTKLGECCMPI